MINNYSKIIEKVLPIKLYVNRLFLDYKKNGMHFKIYNGESLKELIDDALSTYLTENQRNNQAFIDEVLKDIIYCQLKYKLKPGEYFNFDFYGKPTVLRETYITDQQRVEMLLKLNGAARKFELRDKFVFYSLAQPFFKRKVFHLDTHTDIKDLSDFCFSAKKIFCKPNKGAMGVGICSFQIGEETDINEIYNRLLSNSDDWIIEETMVQGKELAEWNETSINTIRFPSFFKDDKFVVYYPKIRVGRKGQIVDNFAQGGMIAMIDGKTGVICTDAYTKSNKIVTIHPDSGKPFKGEKIPHWDDLLLYAEALHRSMPQHVYVAWDFAYTDKGWDIVEANWGQLGSTQMMLGHGIKKEFEALANLK